MPVGTESRGPSTSGDTSERAFVSGVAGDCSDGKGTPMTVRWKLSMTVPSREERTAELFRDVAEAVREEFERMEVEHPTEGRAQ